MSDRISIFLYISASPLSTKEDGGPEFVAGMSLPWQRCYEYMHGSNN